ncbi:MAG: murein transglycosylase A [Thermodesulfobacteriota bacterium]
MKNKILIANLFLIFFTVSCATFKTEKYPQFREVSIKNYPGFEDDMSYDGILRAIDKSLEYYSRFKDDREFNIGEKKIKKTILEKGLKKFRNFVENDPEQNELETYIKNNFKLYSPYNKKHEKPVLFTGYYEPELKGSLEKTEKYNTPLYLLPENLLYVDLQKFSDSFENRKLIARKNGNRVIPYYTNEEIAFEMAIRDDAEVLVWVDSIVELFFLQIQGSGKVYLEQGGIKRVHYAGTNGHSYKSIGKYLIDQGKMSLENMSMQNLKKYLKENPDELREILSHNESYVFFEEVEGGPYGALSKELTPGRSLASDLSIYPRGGLVYVSSRKPAVSGDKDIKKWKNMKRFMLIQDTGGAIKDYFRGDIFFGCGEYAETAAGHLADRGEIYILLPDETLEEAE